MTPQARQRASERIAQALATTQAVWSEEERREAARALGWGDVMAGPQEEIRFDQGDRDGADSDR